MDLVISEKDAPPAIVSRITSFRLFRWKVASICLVALAIIYLLSVALALFLAHGAAKSNEVQLSGNLYKAVIWNTCIACLLLVGRWMVRRRTQKRIETGILLLGTAFVFMVLSSLKELDRPGFAGSMFEEFLTALPLFYAIISAVGERKSLQQ